MDNRCGAENLGITAKDGRLSRGCGPFFHRKTKVGSHLFDVCIESVDRSLESCFSLKIVLAFLIWFRARPKAFSSSRRSEGIESCFQPFEAFLDSEGRFYTVEMYRFMVPSRKETTIVV